ncbi:MAG: hypothetical protein ACOX4U_00605 [Anaerovoracaceae bacterium]
MPKSKWKVQSNVIAGKKMYIPYRILNTDLLVHSGNVEHFGEYTEDRSEAEHMVEMLNEEEPK